MKLQSPHGPWVPYAVALLLVMAAFGFRLLLEPILGLHAPSHLMILAVAGAAWTGGLKPGLFATALATLFAGWYLLRIDGAAQASETAHQIGLVTFLVTGVLLSLMGEVIRRALARAEERRSAAAAAERKLTVTLDSLSEGFIRIDTNWRFTHVNLAAARSLQRQPEELLGRTFWEAYPNDADTPLADHFRRSMGSRVPTHFEHFCPALSAWQDYRVYPVDDGIAVFFVDITASKKAMEALRRSEEEFRLLAESVPQLVWRADPDGKVKYYSSRIADYAGASPRPDGSWEWRPMLHPDDLAATSEAWASAMQTGETYRMEHRVKMADGTFRWHLSRAFPTRARDGTIARWFGTATDIHEHKAAAKQLDELVQKRTAEVRETIAELESMSYSIVHDMRAPLRSIIGFSRVIAEEEGDRLTEEGRSILGRLCAAADRLDALIRDVLAYTAVSRTDELMEPVNCETLLHEIVTDYPNLFGANIEFHPPFPAVIGNRAWLTQVFSNLLGNAAKFVAPGVTPHIRIHADVSDSTCRYWFEDNGIGIPENIQKRLFNIFQRGHTASEYPGTGIGLAIVRRAVERMGGRCGVESKVGDGSRFWLELRLASTAPGPTQIPRPAESGSSVTAK